MTWRYRLRQPRYGLTKGEVGYEDDNRIRSGGEIKVA